MATDLGQLVYTLTLNDEGFQGQLNGATSKVKESSGQMSGSLKETEEQSGKTSGAFSGMAGQFVAGAAIFTVGQKALGAVKGAMSGAIQASKDWQTQEAITEGQLKLSGVAAGFTKESLVKLAEATQKSTAVSREAALAGENQLLTFQNIGTKVMPTATDAATRLASSMASGMIPTTQMMTDASKSLGIALDDPAKGYSRLHRNGVDFTAQQVEQMKTLQAAGNMFGAQQIILKGVDEHYASLNARTKTWQYQVAQLHNTFNDFIGTMMNKLIPILTSVANFLARHKTVAEALMGAIAGLAIVIAGAMVVALWSAVAGFLALSIAALPWIAAAMVIGAIAILIAANWKTLKNFFAGFISDVKQWFADGVNFIRDHWLLLVGILTGPIGLAVAMIASHFNQIKQAFQGVISWIKGAVSGFGSMLVGAGGSLIDGLVHGIENAAGKVFDAVKNVGNKAVKELKGVLKIFSPSQVFAELGGHISTGLAQGITAAANVPIQATTQMATNVINAGKNTPVSSSSNSSSSLVYNFQAGSVVLSTAQAVDEFFNIGNRSTALELQGGSPLAGTTRV